MYLSPLHLFIPRVVAQGPPEFNRDTLYPGVLIKCQLFLIITISYYATKKSDTQTGFHCMADIDSWITPARTRPHLITVYIIFFQVY